MRYLLPLGTHMPNCSSSPYIEVLPKRSMGCPNVVFQRDGGLYLTLAPTRFTLNRSWRPYAAGRGPVHPRRDISPLRPFSHRSAPLSLLTPRVSNHASLRGNSTNSISVSRKKEGEKKKRWKGMRLWKLSVITGRFIGLDVFRRSRRNILFFSRGQNRGSAALSEMHHRGIYIYFFIFSRWQIFFEGYFEILSLSRSRKHGFPKTFFETRAAR